MERYLIYALVDPRDGQPRYIGRSGSGMNRPRQHRTPSSLKSRTHKNHWIRQLLENGLNYEIKILLQSPTKLGQNEAEIFWIDEMKKRGFCLTNSTKGGDGSTEEAARKIGAAMKGRRHTEASREKIRRAATGRKASPEAKAKMSESWARRSPVSSETRQKLSDGQRGKIRSPETRQKMSAGQRGRAHSPEARQKMRERARGRSVSQEARDKIAAANKGKVMSQETRDKIRQALLAKKRPES